MAITDPRVTGFSNATVRPYADKIVQNYYRSKSLVNWWFSQGLNSLVTNDTTLISDGAGTGTDSRPQMTGAQMTAVITQAQAIVTLFEANSNAILNALQGVSVNPLPTS